ncbi:hybrid sensor histidine kinase/response regulator [Desulfurivibrio alkaliphilus]|uniref:histidine kinase n=1 Tax=Desulfurivibrio alkaliphilus (strain DSM 19089 / UNIQEM U267 / AHT2) TaxID=589865 RepID=D6Z2N0_DESAT|nr:hybrid sensor histidine kinase/response regulator [Desulfurivibrio alkaliphilus]ADH85805.1 multi-sensor signal transduction histidine kinase [Desulfurivibrio alkaliphilus AHT 2]
MNRESQATSTIRRILVVDNNPLIVKMLERFLTDEGFEVKSAADGLAALQVLDEYTPDLIFVDLIMPNISGEKLCRVIRATDSLRGVRLVVLSAVVAEENVDFQAFGADACIAKGPFAELKENIRAVLAMLVQQPEQAAREIIGRENLLQRGVTRELLDIRRYFDAILQSMSDGVVQLSRQRRIVFVNRAVTEMIGWPEEKILSSNLLDHLSAAAATLLEAALVDREREIATTGKVAAPCVIGEEEEVLLGGRQVLLTLLPLVERQDSSCWLVMQDITERKRAAALQQRYQQQLEEEIERQTAELAQRYRELQSEVERRKQTEAALQASHDELEARVAARTAEVEKLYSQLLHSEKLRAVGKLAASIAHEFNNPICGIRNVLQGLQRRQTLAAGDHDLVAMAVRECDRVARLTSDLQSFNRPTSSQLVMLDVHAALKDILLLCQKDLENGKVEVRQELAPDLPPVRAVPDQLKQVFLNLLTNAREAIGPTGGRIVIATRREDDEVMISFCDSGCGIAAENLERIYEPFFSTKPAVKGTGLGLAVSYGIVQRHGGRLEVESREGQGACFKLFLPLPKQ